MSSRVRVGRASWHRAANSIVVLYLAGGVGIAVYQREWPPSWLLVHVMLLGFVTNAIVIWTAHFTSTLVAEPTRHGALAGPALPKTLTTLNIGVVLVLTCASWGVLAGVIIGAALIAMVAVSRIAGMARTLRRVRRARFAPVVLFYAAAVVALLCAVAAGVALEVGVSGRWYPRVYAVHVELNLFGWISLTVLGTLTALWPMVLRTRVVSGAESAAGISLVACLTGLVVTVSGLLVASKLVAVIGVATYTLGVARSLEAFVRTAVQRTPRSPAALMLLAALCWFVGGLGADLGKLVGAPDFDAYAGSIGRFAPWMVVGFVVQVVVGALTYLLPVVLGGGPVGARRLAAKFDRWGIERIAAFNIGAVLLALSDGGVGARIGSVLVGGALVAFCASVVFAITPAATT